MREKILQRILTMPQSSLQEILKGKEERAERQQKIMQAEPQGTLICFTLNIAGAVKNAPLFEKAFEEGKRRILRQLRYDGSYPILQEEHDRASGKELYILVEQEIAQVKRRMVEIEDGFELGRLFDIDVMSQNCPKISRRDLGLPARKCLICSQQAAACARSQRHSAADLLEKTVELICDYLKKEFAGQVAQTACRALLYEVACAPKPGLVDRENSGSHRDMDCFTFIDSACALFPYFSECAGTGMELWEDLPLMFARLRCLGKEAEDRMKRATGGINTHKGAVFSMGILCAATAAQAAKEKLNRQTGTSEQEWEKEISALCAGICAEVLEDFAKINQKEKLSYGEQLFKKYGIKGIRQEAANGFPDVFKVGLRCLKEETAKGRTLNDAGVTALLALLCSVQDSNIVARSDWDMLIWAQERAKELLAQGATHAQIRDFNREMEEKNISPGGCADLLALSYFLLFWEREERIGCPDITAQTI